MSDRTWSAWTANAAPWRELLQSSGRCAAWIDKAKTWLGPPEWRPIQLGGPLTIAEPDIRERGGRELPVPKARRFAVAVLLYVGGLLAVLQQVQSSLGGPALAVLAAAGLALMAAAGAGLEGQKSARPLGIVADLALGLAAPLLLGWHGAALGLWTAATVALVALGLARDPPQKLAPD